MTLRQGEVPGVRIEEVREVELPAVLETTGQVTFNDRDVSTIVSRVQGRIDAGFIVSSLFMLVGLYIVLYGIAGIRGRQLIEEEGGDIAFSLLLFRLRVRPRRARKKEVEEVSIKPVPERNNEKQLVIRSDKLIMRISGQKLSPKELEWLKVAVSVIVSGSLQNAR